MTFEAVSYSALADDDEEEREDLDQQLPSSSGFSYGAGPDAFVSPFTYARYNDLDRMGYEAPKRFAQPFTYAARFDEVDESDQPEQSRSLIEHAIIAIACLFTLLTLPFSLLFTLRFVSSNEKMVVLRLGRAQRVRGTGTSFTLPCIDKSYRIDTRVTAFNVPPLHVLTSDGGLVEIGAVVFVKVRDAVSAVCAVHDRNTSTRSLATTMLYRFVASQRLCQLTSGHQRRMLAQQFKEDLGQFTSRFGVEITEVELSDVKVIREPENTAMSSLRSVAKSEVGQQLWQVVGPVIEDLSREANEERAQRGEAPAYSPSLFSPPDLLDLSSSKAATCNGQVDVDIDHIIAIVNMGIDETLTRSVNRVFQFDCTGIESLVVDLRRGQCYKGRSPSADVTLTLDRATILPLLKQQLSPMTAYMDGRLKITGSFQDAFALRALADRVAHLL